MSLKENEQNESSHCICGVPYHRHGTSCGWKNADVIVFPWETHINTTITAEENKLRYLISRSPNSLKLATHFFKPKP